MPERWPKISVLVVALRLYMKRKAGMLSIRTYLGNDVSQFLLHFLLCAQESLPQVIANASPLQKRSARLLGSLDVDQALDILHCATQEGRSQDAIGDPGGLLGAFFGIEMHEGEVDVSLEVRAEPGREVCAFSCSDECVSVCGENVMGESLGFVSYQPSVCDRLWKTS